MSAAAMIPVLVLGISISGGHSLRVAKLGPAMTSPIVPFGAKSMGMSEAVFEVIHKTHISVAPTDKCICKPYEYWHWEKMQCLQKEGVGFDCGAFPVGHQQLVCQDGLLCKNSSCKMCAAEDKCQVMQEVGCLRAYRLVGEACATVRVVVPPVQVTMAQTATAVATASASKQVQAYATAAAVESATVTEQSEHSDKGQTNESAQGDYKQALSDRDRAENVKAANLHDAGIATSFSNLNTSRAVTVTKIGVGQARATGTAVAETKVIAFATATAEATKEVSAKMDLTYQAFVQASGNKTREASAQSRFTAEASACVSADDAILVDGNKISLLGIVQGTQLASAALKKAFNAAAADAKELAESTGFLTAKGVANKLAGEQAREAAKLQAQANADEALAQEVERNAQKWAENTARSQVEQLAKASAKKEATQAASTVAKFAAIESAVKMGREQAQLLASENAKATTLSAASDAARDAARKAAAIAAQKTANLEAEKTAHASAKAAAKGQIIKEAQPLTRL